MAFGRVCIMGDAAFAASPQFPTKSNVASASLA